MQNDGLPYLVYVHGYYFLEDLINSILDDRSKCIFKDVAKLYYLPQRICKFFYDGIVTREDKLYKVMQQLRQDERYAAQFKEEEKRKPPTGGAWDTPKNR